MKYVNTTNHGIYASVPGQGHKYFAPGAEQEVTGNINVPGLKPVVLKIARKKPTSKPVVNTKTETIQKNDLRTSD